MCHIVCQDIYGNSFIQDSYVCRKFHQVGAEQVKGVCRTLMTDMVPKILSALQYPDVCVDPQAVPLSSV